MKKFTVLLLTAMTLVMSSCFEDKENYNPDPMQPAYSYYGYTALQNEIALLPANIEKRLELYKANGKTSTVAQQLLPNTTIEELPDDAWKLTFTDAPISKFRITGVLFISDGDDPQTRLISTTDKTIEIESHQLLFMIRNSYFIKKVSATETEISMTMETFSKGNNVSYPWTGTYSVVEHADNTTDLTSINSWKYKITAATAQGSLAFGDNFYIVPGAKFGYTVIEPLYYASTGDKKFNICSGTEQVVPYSNGVAAFEYKVVVKYTSSNESNPYSKRGSISYTYQGQTKTF